MLAAELDAPLIVYTNADWREEPLVFAVGSIATLDDFTGCSIIGGLYVDGTLVLDMNSTSTTRTAISLPSTVNISVLLVDITALVASASGGLRDYQLSLVLVTASAAKQPLVVGIARIQNP